MGKQRLSLSRPSWSLTLDEYAECVPECRRCLEVVDEVLLGHVKVVATSRAFNMFWTRYECANTFFETRQYEQARSERVEFARRVACSVFYRIGNEPQFAQLLPSAYLV